MPNKMLIDASHPEETRVVVVHGNRIEEFDFESQDKKQLKGNIYLARVTRVEPSLQAAFVEYGGNRHGFLAFSEIHPDYYQIPVADRQALLRAEAEAAEEDDEDAEEPRAEHGRSRRRRRGGRSRNGDAEQAAASAESVEIPVAAEESSDEPHAAEADAPAGEQDVAADSAAEAQSPAEVPAADDEAPAVPAEDAPGESASGEENGGSGSMAAAIEADVISEPRETEIVEEDATTIEEVADAAPEAQEIESVGAEDAIEEARNRRKPLRRHYKIQEVIKRRQILLVQVVKEERGNKGAALTTYLSLAGRYSVLMPNTARGGGISRKITSAQDRKRLKEVMQDLEVPQGMGVILRTAGESRTKAEIKRDYEYLMRMWETVRTLTLQSTAPTLVYEEGSLIKRSVRDLYNKDIDEILVSGEDGYREAKDFMRMLMPSHAKVVQPYRESTPIFVRNGIESQLDRMVQPQVTLKSGGYIIINQTEALVSIDVNSGRSTREHSIEETALHTNLEAAEEVARQLRLRDLAGLIVIDFIDMEENRNNRAVEKRLKDCLKNDRARIQLGRISHFGLMEMSRQRIRASVLESTMKPCPHCGGTGHVRSDSSVALLVVRAIEEFLLKDSRSHITVRTPASTAMYVLNHKRSTLTEMEARFGVTITIEVDDSVASQHLAIFRGAIAEKPVAPPSVGSDYVAIEADEDLDVAMPEDEGVAADDSERRDEADSRDRKRRRRRRRRGGRDRDDHAPHQQSAADDVEDDENGAGEPAEAQEESPAQIAEEADGQGNGERKKRRRGKRGGRKSRSENDAGSEESPAEAAGDEDEAPAPEAAAAEPVVEEAVAEETVAEEPAPRPSRRRAARAAPAAKAAQVTEAADDVRVASVPAPQAEAEEATAVAGPDAEPAEAEPTRVPNTAPPAASAPVLQSSEPASDAPKKGGWWQRRSFF